jgi:hypothetical protein
VAERDKVGKVVGFKMPFRSEFPKRNFMMNVEGFFVCLRRLAAFLANLIARSTVSLGFAPGRAVVRIIAAAPCRTISTRPSAGFGVLQRLTLFRTALAAVNVAGFCFKFFTALNTTVFNGRGQCFRSSKFLAVMRMAFSVYICGLPFAEAFT